MEVRVAAGSRLEARHGQVRLLLRAWQHRRHYHLHRQLRPERDHVLSQVRRRAHEVETHVVHIVLIAFYRLAAKRSTYVQPMDLVQRVVLRIQRPPDRRDAAEAVLVLHTVLLRDERLHVGFRSVALLHPRGPPREKLHGGRQLLPFEGPLHRRRPHVATNSLNRPYKGTRRILALEHLPELPLG